MGKASEELNRTEAAGAASTLQTGSATLTVKLRNQYGREDADAQTNDKSVPKWPEWLRSNGYGLDSKGLVYKIK